MLYYPSVSMININIFQIHITSIFWYKSTNHNWYSLLKIQLKIQIVIILYKQGLHNYQSRFFIYKAVFRLKIQLVVYTGRLVYFICYQ